MLVSCACVPCACMVACESLRVRRHLRVRERACVRGRACEGVRARACVRERACESVRARACVRGFVNVMCVRGAEDTTMSSRALMRNAEEAVLEVSRFSRHDQTPAGVHHDVEVFAVLHSVLVHARRT